MKKEKKFNAVEEQVKEMLERVEQKCLEANLSPWEWYLKFAPTNPQNYVTKREYTGSNRWVCGMLGVNYTISMTELTRINDKLAGVPEDTPFDKDAMIYRNTLYKKYKDNGGVLASIKKGSKTIPIVFTKTVDKKDLNGELVRDENGNVEQAWFARLYRVFDINDIEGYDFKIPEYESVPDTFKPIERAEAVASAYCSKVGLQVNHINTFGASGYSPSYDRITMSLKKLYKSEDMYYQTLYHELGHSTGTKDRKNRSGITHSDGFGKDIYAEEELVAEFCSMFSMKDFGIETTFDNDCAYIKSWWEHLKKDPKKFARACNAGFRAKEYIFNEELAEEVA